MNLSAHEARGADVRRGGRVETSSHCSSAKSEGGKHTWRYFGARPELNLKARKECVNCGTQGDYND